MLCCWFQHASVIAVMRGKGKAANLNPAEAWDCWQPNNRNSLRVLGNADLNLDAIFEKMEAFKTRKARDEASLIKDWGLRTGSKVRRTTLLLRLNEQLPFKLSAFHSSYNILKIARDKLAYLDDSFRVIHPHISIRSKIDRTVQVLYSTWAVHVSRWWVLS